MLRDATREEALAWCRANWADFKTPVFPPPNGWAWGESGDALVLTPIFTNTTDADITSADLGMRPAPALVQ